MPGEKDGKEKGFDSQAYPDEKKKENEGKETPPAQPKDKEYADYPMPNKEKPLKIDGSALEAIILVPKGMTIEYPKMSAAIQPLPPAVDAEKIELKKKNEELIAELTKIKAELAKRETEDLVKLATTVVEERLSKGLLTADKKDDEIKNLSKLPKEQIEILLADAKKLEKTASPAPQPKTKDGSEKALAANEQKKLEMRKTMFGHEQPAGEFYKQNPPKED
jgi:hypothetical protein